MKIVIAGVGETGFYLAQLLHQEGHDLYLIEKNAKAHQNAQEHLDAQIILGDMANAIVLEPIVDQSVDVFIALTDNDESNVIGSLIARKFGAKRVITRMSDPNNLIHPLLTDDPNVSVLNAEMIVSRDLTRLVGNPSADEIEFFAGGKAEMVKLHVNEDAQVAYRKIKDIKFPKTWLIVAAIREGEFSIASGETTLNPGDQVLAIGNPEEYKQLENILGLHPTKVRRVIINGMNDISAKLAQSLKYRDIDVRLVEESRYLADQAAAQLDAVLVIQGDGTDDEVLEQAGIDQTDYMLALTNDDETNVLTSLLAKEKGAKRVVALTQKPHYKPIIEKIGIDSVVNPRSAMADEIIRCIHHRSLSGINILEGGQGRMVEFAIQKKTKIVDVPISKIKLPKNVLIGAIVREEQVIIPRGDQRIKVGDHILIFSTLSQISQIEHLFSQ